MKPSHYRFGEFTLDAARRVLYLRGAVVALGPKPLQLLALLVGRAGSLVSKAELMDALWPDGFVEEGNLTQYVYLLRGALRDGGLSNAIETVPRRGYRFAAAVETGSVAAKRRPQTWAYARIVALAVAVLLVVGPAAPAVSAFANLSVESQRLYALGRFHWTMRGDGRIENLRESVRDFRGVVARDPGNPLGYSGLADAFLSLYDYPCDERGCANIAARALSSARRAVELGPNSAEAHTSLAMMLHAFASDDTRAAREFQRAIALDPNYATSHAWYGTMLVLHGNFKEARAQLAQAVALDPVAPASYAWLARASYYDHRYDDAIAYAREALALEPHRFETHVILGLALASSGRAAAAIEVFHQLAETGGDPVQVRALIATALARSGDDARAKMLLAASGKPQRDADYLPDIAMAWIAVGDQQRALSYFSATRPLDDMHRRLLAPDPRLDGIRNDPRFDTWATQRV